MADRPLHVFHNGVDSVVAHDADDAWAAWCEHIGEQREDYRESHPFIEYDDAHELTILCDDADPNDPAWANGKRTQTCGEWARENGRGFLCSTEW